jgi:geranylgeranyl pyrophosphate synthase
MKKDCAAKEPFSQFYFSRSAFMKIPSLLQKFNEALQALTLTDVWNQSQNKAFNFECTEAHLYPLMAGGKRVRPMLCLLTASAFGGPDAASRAMASAMALECVHTYSLVHDDMPCMDNDDLRRGKPTTHKVYGDAQALLVGDGLLTCAFQLLVEPEILGLNFAGSTDFMKIQAVKLLSKAAGPAGMVRGQWLDLKCDQLETLSLGAGTMTKQHSKADELLECIHELKTGALLGASLELGFLHSFEQQIAVNIRQQSSAYFEQLGRALGLFFQIQDDLLDTQQSSQTLGKTSGKDQAANKFTAVSLWGIEKSKNRLESLKWEVKETLQCVWNLVKDQPNFKGHSSNLNELLTFFNDLSQRQA